MVEPRGGETKIKKPYFKLLLLIVVAAICGVIAWQRLGPDPVAGIGGFTDGGTLAVTLVNRRGCKEAMCFDYRIGTATLGRLYIGAPHPTLPGAKLVPLGSNVEKHKIGILQRHLNRQLWPWQEWELAALDLAEVAKRKDEKTYYQYRLIKAIEKLKALEAGQQSES